MVLGLQELGDHTTDPPAKIQGTRDQERNRTTRSLRDSKRGWVPAAGAWRIAWTRLVDDVLVFGVGELVQRNADWSNASHSSRLPLLHDRDHGFMESVLDDFDGLVAAEEATRHEHPRQCRAEDSRRL